MVAGFSDSTSVSAERTSGFFAGVEDVPPHQDTVGYRWRTTLGRACRERCAVHAVRHRCASGLTAPGCNVVAVQRAPGHATSTTTLTAYGHLGPSARGLRQGRWRCS